MCNSIDVQVIAALFLVYILPTIIVLTFLILSCSWIIKKIFTKKQIKPEYLSSYYQNLPSDKKPMTSTGPSDSNKK